MATHLGQNVLQVHDIPRFRLGSRIVDEEGREFVYCKSESTIAADICVSIATGYVVAASGNAGHIFGVTPVASVSGDYLWVQTRGLVSAANVATGTSAGDRLNHVTDANGDFVTNAGDATRAVAQTAEAAGLAAVLLV